MLYFYHGSDAYRLRDAVHAIIERAGAGVSTTHIDLTEKNQAEELERILKYPSFFQEPTIIVARNVLANATIAQEALDLLERYDAPALTDVTIIAIHEASGGRESAATKKLTTYLTQHATEYATYDLFTGGQRAAWMRSFCETRGCTLSAPALSVLNARATDDTWGLANELEKLCAYADGNEITADAITTLIPPPIDHDEFALTNALYNHNKRGALSALWQRITEGTPEQLLLGTLASATRTLIAVKSGNTSGIHPFVAGKARTGALAYTDQQLTTAHLSLATLDRSSKDGLADLTDGLFGVLLGL